MVFGEDPLEMTGKARKDSRYICPYIYIYIPAASSLPEFASELAN
jgi:hypothetical protein